jgi:hypothetical protein
MSFSPSDHDRRESALPRPTMAGSASCAPASAQRRSNGIGLISVLIGMKPETTDPRSTATGSRRSAIDSAAAARTSGASASRRLKASSRSAAFFATIEATESIRTIC